ncbi:MAG: hypothetical protein J7513_08930 [Solirubrobacteraceae bacterium]|nr:hypothetical protein [Solirubrobacteraceae bacterium]
MPSSLRGLRPHPTRLDLAVTLLMTALGLVLARSNYLEGPTATPEEGGPFVVSVWVIPAFLLITLPLLWRSTAPRAALGAVVLALAVHAVLFGEIVRCGVAFPTIGFLAFAAATLGPRARRQGLTLAIVATLLVGVFDALSANVLVVGMPVTLVSFGLGLLAASRSRMVARLRDQTDELQHARDERARLEVATDRADLSGELDALLQQRLSTLAALAQDGGALADGAEAAATLARIEQESRATLNDMRQLVGSLRGTDGAIATAPMPTLTSLEALVVRTRGPRSRVVVEGDPRVLPPGVELSAYRIVEHLIGALDDAPGVEVRVGFAADRLELRVQGNQRRRGEFASNLAKARARVELHDGTLSSRSSGQRIETTATLPMLARA